MNKSINNLTVPLGQLKEEVYVSGMSTFANSLFRHIPQALHFDYIVYSFWEPDPVC